MAYHGVWGGQQRHKANQRGTDEAQRLELEAEGEDTLVVDG